MPPTLSPEHKRLIEVFSFQYQFYNRSSMTFVVDLTVDDVTIEDTRMFVHGKIGRRNLPHSLGWVWNQSKSRKSAILSNNTNVDFYKLCTRKRDPGDNEFQSPGYKLWKFEIKKPNSEQIVVLWCEKGTASEGKPNTPYTNKIQEFTLRSSN